MFIIILFLRELSCVFIILILLLIFIPFASFITSHLPELKRRKKTQGANLCPGFFQWGRLHPPHPPSPAITSQSTLAQAFVMMFTFSLFLELVFISSIISDIVHHGFDDLHVLFDLPSCVINFIIFICSIIFICFNSCQCFLPFSLFFIIFTIFFDLSLFSSVHDLSSFLFFLIIFQQSPSFFHDFHHGSSNFVMFSSSFLIFHVLQFSISFPSCFIILRHCHDFLSFP